MYFTAGPSLRGHAALPSCRVGLDGAFSVKATSTDQGSRGRDAHGDVRGQRRRRLRPAHAFAVRDGVRRGPPTDRMLRVEALAMFGLSSGVPVAEVRSARFRTRPSPTFEMPSCPAYPRCCWRITGCSSFIEHPELAIPIGGIVEEAAQAGINASGLGGPVEIPEELRAAALQRAMLFAQHGTAHA